MRGDGRCKLREQQGDSQMSNSRPPNVTAIITFHREGLIAHKSLLSLLRCRMAAEQAGISLELIATLDRADEETTRIATAHLEKNHLDRLIHLDCGDLGSSRNIAIQNASGENVLICDGDDYLSADYIVRCMDSASKTGPDAILHPELVVTFEAETNLWWQSGSDQDNFDSACMLVMNPWNACSFGARNIYLKTPYVRARPGESGFGYEDWHWNCETLSSGYEHLIAKRTAHYVRKKSAGSLNNAHTNSNAIIPPTRLFDLQ